MSMLIFMPLVVEGVQLSEGEKVEPQQFPRDFLFFWSVVLLTCNLPQIRALAKCLKYECKCKMYEREMKERT